MHLSDRSKAVMTTILVVLIIMLLLLAAEGLTRVRQYFKHGMVTSINRMVVEPNTGLHIPQPGMEMGNIRINSLGFRGPELTMPRQAGSLRIGFIGASTTYCAEVSSNEAVWTELVARNLESATPGLSVDYINGGVPGYSTTQSLVNLEQRLLPLQPDIVVIYHASNDLSAETRKLAKKAGIERTNLEEGKSFLGKYSLLWSLVEKNLAIMNAQHSTDAEMLTLERESLGEEFRKNLKQLVRTARDNGVKLVALATFAIHLREDMTPEQQSAAMVSARYYMPYLSASDMLAAFASYNEIIREVAASTGAVLIDGQDGIPGDPVHFNDSVHFTDAGSQAQAERVANALRSSDAYSELIATIHQE
jgi:lysophospholipase L1-like esterase